MPKTKWRPQIPEAAPCVLIEAPPGTSSARADGWLFANPRETIRCDRAEDAAGCLSRLDAARADGRWLAGYVAYEALTSGARADPALPLIYMLVCDAPQPVRIASALEGLRGLVAGNGNGDAPYSLRSVPEPGGIDRQRYEQREAAAFHEAVVSIRASLGAGECYQVNYTRQTHYRFAGDPIALYERLRRLQPAEYGALILDSAFAVLSHSPELFFDLNYAGAHSVLETRPMKGTAPRYSDPERDRAVCQGLATDQKTLAEHRMIVDLLRNDLGKHARFGGVSLPDSLRLESHATLHQMTSLVRAELPEAMDVQLFSKVFPAIFPCGSITGAPKRDAMRIIAELETEPRGVYTGAIGFAGPERARFNVAIRTLEIGLLEGDAKFEGGVPGTHGANARYGSGCGIVWDSDADAEWSEYRLKQAFLQPACDDFALIETMYFDGSKFVLLREHCERLLASAAHFHIDCAESEVLGKLDRLSVACAGQQLRVRLSLSGQGAIRIEHRPWPQPYRELDLNAPPASLDSNSEAAERAAREDELTVGWATERVFSGDPFRRHKTTRRAVYDDALAAAREAGLDDLLFLNERGEIAESAIANLLLQTDSGEWLTPDPDCGALPGVCLAGLDRRYPGRVRRACLHPADVSAAAAEGRCYLVNSLRGAQSLTLVSPEPATAAFSVR